MRNLYQRKVENFEQKNSTNSVVCFQMLEAILQNATTADLLRCRQINRHWNEISSRIMRQRADIERGFLSITIGRSIKDILCKKLRAVIAMI